jgi:type IV pilus assembly protein PilW
VEIMVALAISLVLLLGVIQIFMGSKKTYRMQEALSRVQENGRFAISFLSRGARLVGFRGCLPVSSSNVENILNDQGNYGWNINAELEGHDGGSASTWDPVLPTILVGAVVDGTDVVTERSMSPDGISLVSPFSDSAQLFVDPSLSDFADGEILMVTDCKQGSVFQATNIQASGGKIDVVHSSSGGFTPGNAGPQLANTYGADAKLARMQTSAYYIGISTDTGNPALFRSHLVTTGGANNALQSEELVDNVEDMQILYGEDTDNDGSANRYVNASSVGDMSNVVALRIAVLVRSDDFIKSADDTATTYTLLDKTDGPFNDRRLRRVFITTVALRNRL